MKINKTIKLYIGGEFVRTESGRSYPEHLFGSEEVYANLCQGSRKDFRKSVKKAKSALKSWTSKTAYNRSQILYRMAEMANDRKEEFVTLFENILGYEQKKAIEEFDKGLDTFVYYAGFCDKFSQIACSVNPVAAPYHNFTTQEPTGVVCLVEDDQFNFQKLIDHICSILVGGNSLIVILGKECGSILAPLSEVLATSDLPGGVVNLLTASIDEIWNVVATHRELNSISFQSDDFSLYCKMRESSIDNMKRVVPKFNNVETLENILAFVENKTVWHPIGV